MAKIKSFLKDLDITVENTFFTIAFFTGATLTYFEIDLYRLTFIPFIIPFSIWIITGIVATPLLYKRLLQYLKYRFLLYQIAFNILTWGGIVLYLFMALNFHLTGMQHHEIALKVIEDGKFYVRRQPSEPFKVVNYKGINKTLIFSQDTYAYELYTVNLTLRKGLFGFDVIESKILSK